MDCTYFTKNLINYLKPARVWLFLILIFVLVPDLMAANGDSDINRDTSITFLSTIFGNISSSYENLFSYPMDRSLLGIGFEYFNKFVVSVGAVVVTYITVVSLMNSASSGSPLGQKWHTLFLPLRVTAGAAMLIPNAYGYNLAQVVTMWFILTGVNGANQVWDQVADLLNRSGNTAISGNVSPADNDTGDLKTLKQIKDSMGLAVFAACVKSYVPDAPKDDSAYNSDGDKPPVTPSRQVTVGKMIGSNLEVTPNEPEIKDRCGTLKISQSKLQNTAGHQEQDEYNEKLTSAINSLLAVTVVKITDIVVRYKASNNPDSITTSTDTLPSGQGSDVSNFWELSKDNLTGYYNDIFTISGHYLVDKSQKDQSIYKAAKKAGWIMAGASYYGIISSSGNAVINGPSDVYNIIGKIEFTDQQLESLLTTLQDKVTKYVTSNAPNSAKSKGTDDNADVKIQFDTGYTVGVGTVLSGVGLGIPNLIETIVKNIFNPANSLGFEPTIKSSTDPAEIRKAIANDPLQKLSEAGGKLSYQVEVITFSAMTAQLIAAIPAAINPAAQPVGIGVVGMPVVILFSFVFVALQMVVILFGLFYPSAILMNIYIPLIPFMIYTVGVIGWLLLTIEAMAAAPIVAIGLMHPEGQSESLGRAEQGLMLLLNLMLRPVLMVIGLCAGIITVRIALLFFSWGMSLVFASGLVHVSSLGGLGASLMIFTGAIAIIVHKSFDLINKIPDKILTWIGAQGASVGESGDFLQRGERDAGQGGATASSATSGLAKGAKSAYGTASDSKKKVGELKSRMSGRGNGGAGVGGDGGGGGGGG